MVSDANTQSIPIGLVVLITSLGFAVIQLDITAVNVALPYIGRDLQADYSGLQWTVDIYSLVFASFLLTAGVLSDKFGPRPIYMIGLLFFAAASICCGLAGTAAELIAGRAGQGIGAAIMLPSSLALVNHVSAHTPKLRAWAVGWWTAAGSIAISSGPIIGGAIIAIADWRAIFLINPPICLVAAFFVRHLPGTTISKERNLDIPGQLLCIISLGSIVAGAIESRILGPAHPLIFTMLAIGICASVSFIFVEKIRTSPMLPLSLFKIPAFTACVLYGAAMNLTYYGLLFILSFYLQGTLGYTSTEAGFAYLPLTATFIVGNLIGAKLAGRVGPRVPMLLGALIDATGFTLLLSLGSASPYLAMLLPFALIPGGMGMGIPAATTAVLSSVPPEAASIGVAVLNSARQAAGAIGVAIFGALAGEGPAQVVEGLHSSAATAVGLLLVTAVVTTFAMPKSRDGSTRPNARLETGTNH